MPKELRFIVSENIKAIRTKARVTQEELAQKAEVDYKYLQKIEGKDPPNISLQTIEKICQALRVSPSKLFDH